MPRAMKLCPACGTPAPTLPHPPCAPPKPSGTHRTSPHAQGLDARWRRMVARAKKRQPWCAWPPGCEYEITARNPLTGDHLVPRSVDPSRVLDATNVVVLCRRHNSMKGKRTFAEVTESEKGRGTTAPSKGPENAGG